MKTGDDIRRVLQQEAAKHQINPKLDASTITRARVSRFLAAIGVMAAAVSIVFAGIGVAGFLDGAETRIPIARNGYGTQSKRTAPLLLITAEGWRATRADEYGVKSGEITFKNGAQEIGLFWRPAKTHEGYVQDRAASGPELEPMTVAGREAVVFQTEGTTAFNAMWVEGPLSLELRGGAESEEAFRAIAETLAYVDEETWLAAMPGDTVTPEERAAVVDEMLGDVAVHPSVNIDDLKTQHTVSDRYQLGAQVAGAMVCAWIEQWVDAKEKGKPKVASESEDAMASSHRWDILKEMRKQGGFSAVVWEYADAMAGDNNVAAGGTLTVEDGYRSAFGCEG